MRAPSTTWALVSSLACASACGGSVSEVRRTGDHGAANAGGSSGAGGGNVGDGGSGASGASGGGAGTGGATEACGIVLCTGGTSGGTGGLDGASCPAYTFMDDPLLLDIYLLLDQSESMSCATPNSTRWDVVKSALGSFAKDAVTTGIGIGLGYFGTAPSPPSSSCIPSDYQPDVEIGPASTNAPLIAASLSAHAPFTDTPTLPAVSGALLHALDWKARNGARDAAVVLITDGEPNACGAPTVPQIANVASQGLDGGVRTYVVGIRDRSSQCGLDPNPPVMADLDSIAAAGGTEKAFVVDTSSQLDPVAQLSATLYAIARGGKSSCEFALPSAPNGEPLNPMHVNLQLVISPGDRATDLYFVDTETECASTVGAGWHYDVSQAGPNSAAPTKIVLCPSVCSSVLGHFDTSIRVVVGCSFPAIPH